MIGTPFPRRRVLQAVAAATVLLAAAFAEPRAQRPAPSDAARCAQKPRDAGDAQRCASEAQTADPNAGAAAPPAGAPGGGTGGGGAGGGGAQRDADGGAIGPYRVVKVMDLGGETVDGIACTLAEPFVVHMHTRKVDFDIKFEPMGTPHGAWTYAYLLPSGPETHDAAGEYEVGAPAADGTRSLTIDGKDHVVFHGFNGPMPMHYVMQLAPAQTCPR